MHSTFHKYIHETERCFETHLWHQKLTSTSFHFLVPLNLIFIIYLKCTVSLESGRVPSLSLQPLRPWLNMSFVLGVGVGRWGWAHWTLTSEPGGYMSLQAIFEALKYMWQLQGLRVQTTCRRSDRFLEENRPRCVSIQQLSHPSPCPLPWEEAETRPLEYGFREGPLTTLCRRQQHLSRHQLRLNIFFISFLHLKCDKNKLKEGGTSECIYFYDASQYT